MVGAVNAAFDYEGVFVSMHQEEAASGGAYLPPSMLDLFEKYGIAILQGYGMTECSPVISTTSMRSVVCKTLSSLPGIFFSPVFCIPPAACYFLWLMVK